MAARLGRNHLSGTRKILKPAISGNASAATADTRATTAAGTSPLTSRAIAVVFPVLSWTTGPPAAAIAFLTSALDTKYLSSIAMFLSVRSDTDPISGRTMTTATRGLALLGDAPALGSAPSRAAATLALVIRSASHCLGDNGRGRHLHLYR